MVSSLAQPPREWVPSCFLVIHDAHRHSTIRYSPMHIQRAADVTYRSRIRIYDRNPIRPAFTAESEAMRLDDVFALESGQIAQAMGQERLFHYGECYNWSPEMAPPTPNVAMPLHMHYGSDDGSLHGHLASFFIFGAPRQIQRGERHYESFPAAMINRDYLFTAYIVNPFVRPSKCRVRIISGDGEEWCSPQFTVRGKGAGEWNSAGSTFPGSDGPVGVIVESEQKTTSFFGTRTGEGKMIGFDHGHPFLTQVLHG